MVTLDEAGGLVRDALLWNDNRSAGDADDLISELGGPQAWAEAVGSVPGRVDDGVEDPLARPSRARARHPDRGGGAAARLAHLADRRPELRADD